MRLLGSVWLRGSVSVWLRPMPQLDEVQSMKVLMREAISHRGA